MEWHKEIQDIRELCVCCSGDPRGLIPDTAFDCTNECIPSVDPPDWLGNPFDECLPGLSCFQWILMNYKGITEMDPGTLLKCLWTLWFYNIPQFQGLAESPKIAYSLTIINDFTQVIPSDADPGSRFTIWQSVIRNPLNGNLLGICFWGMTGFDFR